MKGEFRRVYLPYCVTKMHDSIGGWIVLNRHYKPLGQPNVWFDYKNIPPDVRIAEITISQQTRLHHGYGNFIPDDTVWLYNDACVPMNTKAYWLQYQEKLAILAKLKLLTEWDRGSGGWENSGLV